MKQTIPALAAAACLLAALLAGCSGAGAAASGSIAQEPAAAQESEEAAAPQEDAPAEDADPIQFEARDLEGNTVTQEVFAGSRLTMVNVWATYCGPCLREMPDLGELAAEYDTADFQLIGIISDVPELADEDALATAADLIEQTGAAYPHLLLNQSLYDELLTDLIGVPTTFFVDSEGNLLSTVIGAQSKDTWEEKINALLETL